MCISKIINTQRTFPMGTPEKCSDIKYNMRTPTFMTSVQPRIRNTSNSNWTRKKQHSNLEK